MIPVMAAAPIRRLPSTEANRLKGKAIREKCRPNTESEKRKMAFGRGRSGWKKAHKTVINTFTLWTTPTFTTTIITHSVRTVEGRLPREKASQMDFIELVLADQGCLKDNRQILAANRDLDTRIETGHVACELTSHPTVLTSGSTRDL